MCLRGLAESWHRPSHITSAPRRYRMSPFSVPRSLAKASRTAEARFLYRTDMQVPRVHDGSGFSYKITIFAAPSAPVRVLDRSSTKNGSAQRSRFSGQDRIWNCHPATPKTAGDCKAKKTGQASVQTERANLSSKTSPARLAKPAGTQSKVVYL